MKIDNFHKKIADAPALMVYRDSLLQAACRGTVLFYHGFKARKETNMKELRGLAEKGFLAVGIDAAGHGEREYPDFEGRISLEGSFQRFMLKMVRETMDEIPKIIDELVKEGIADGEKIGVCGISMGGYIAYGAVLADKRIKVAAPILGSPSWEFYSDESPLKNGNKFYPAALLSQNGGLDINVPAKYAREFHKSLIPHYEKMPERLSYVEYPHSAHFMREEDWNRLWENTLQWFQRFLLPG